jgi:hypothetical protein
LIKKELAVEAPFKMPMKNVAFGVGFYALCSSSMLFFNKLSVSPDGPPHEHVMGPGPVSCIQLGFAMAFCVFLYVSGIEKFEGITNLNTVKMYTMYCVLFVGEGVGRLGRSPEKRWPFCLAPTPSLELKILRLCMSCRKCVRVDEGFAGQQYGDPDRFSVGHAHRRRRA